MKRILIFSEKNFTRAPRIVREIEALQNEFILYLSGSTQNEELKNYSCIYSHLSLMDKIINRSRNLLKRKPTHRFSKIGNYLKDHDIDVVIIHEPHFLPLFTELKQKNNFKLVFNAHEYHPLEFEDIPNWMETEGKNYFHLYANYISKTDLLINVCESIRQKCLSEFGVDSLVMPNATSYKNLSVQNHVESGIRIIHHGANLPSRQIELMIDIVAKLGDNYSMDLMLTSVKGCEEYDEYIDSLIEKTSNVSRRKPVELETISEMINSYDIGLFYLEPTNFNYRYALPNKIFEFIQARLAIAVSPSVEMKHLVEHYEIGVCAPEFSVDSMVKTIQKLSAEDISRFKQNSHKTAQIENAEKYNAILLNKILSLFPES